MIPERESAVAMQGTLRLRVLGIVLAGGKVTQLFPLTRERAKPAVTFGGKYRIIDFVLQFRQFRNQLDLRAHPVPQPVAAPASERGMAVRRTAEEPLHHQRAGTGAYGERNLVSGNCRRHLSEH